MGLFRLQRPTGVEDLARAFEATQMCLRNDLALLERSLRDPHTRWYANKTTGYVRFVRRKVEDRSGQSPAWLLDVSYTRYGKTSFHPSSVEYMLEASGLLHEEFPQDRQFLYADRRLARLYVDVEASPELTTLTILPPVTHPICKYRHDDTIAEEFSRKRAIPATGRFYLLSPV